MNSNSLATVKQGLIPIVILLHNSATNAKTARYSYIFFSKTLWLEKY
jgi:hypothetical protein